ncbi:MAG TPA: sigma-70 family RNA polymerase sigma factor [Planctomycetota bacterium]|nr:sigma-70 family RNA polymerase sigma factor [Planctomycetota bacterium]
MNSRTGIDELLQHAGFLRELAQALCADGTSADDLVQDVWLRTLRAGPPVYTAPRGWLVTLVHRLAANTRRTGRRQRVREQQRGPAPDAPSPETVLAAEQVRERVVRAALAAPAPFREILLLRFWEGLPPRAIAQRLGIPGATVRTRLSRALVHVRAWLDEQHGSDRDQWRLALAPWLGAPSLIGTPLLLMTMKKVTLSLLLAAVALFALFVAWPDETPAPAPLVAASSTAGPGATDPPAANAPAPVRETATPVRTASGTVLDVAKEPRVFPAKRAPGNVFGIVVDTMQRPVAGASVEAMPVTGHLPPGLVVQDDRGAARTTTSDAEGLFRFEGLLEGPFRLRARADATRADEVVIVAAGTNEGPVNLMLAEASTFGDDLRVQVVDTLGQPVADADVKVFTWSRKGPDPEAAARSLRTPMVTGRSGADGRFAVTGRGMAMGVVWVTTDDGRVGFACLSSTWETDPVHARVVVAVAGSLDLHLSGAPAGSLAGAALSLHALGSRAYGAYGVGGGRSLDYRLEGERIAIDGLPAGTYAVSLDAPRATQQGLRLVTKRMSGWSQEAWPNSVELPLVNIVAGQSTAATLAVAAGGAIRGTITCGDRPVRGVRVRAVLAPRTSNFPAGLVLRGARVWQLGTPFENGPDNPIATVIAHSDDAGRYELPGLTPGEWRVEVATPALSFDRREDIAVAEGECVELKHELVRAGVLQVCLLDATYVGVMRPGDAVPVMLALTKDDFATFPGLAPGRYQVARCHTDPRIDPVVVAEAEVVAGRTTWLDLRSIAVSGVVRGKVLSGANPVAGARVDPSRKGPVTGDDGSFRIALGYRPRFNGRGHSGSTLWVRLRDFSWWFCPRAEGVTELDTVLQLGEHFVDVVVADGNGQPRRVGFHVHWEAVEGRPNDGAGALLPESVNGSGKTGADGSVRLGPFPPGRLTGAIDVDGLQVPLQCDVPCADVVRVTAPPTATLVVHTTRAGQRVARAEVIAMTWTGDGAPPATLDEFREKARMATSKSDQDGVARFTVAAGELAVFADNRSSDDQWQRLRVEPGAMATVIVEVQ